MIAEAITQLCNNFEPTLMSSLVCMSKGAVSGAAAEFLTTREDGFRQPDSVSTLPLLVMVLQGQFEEFDTDMYVLHIPTLTKFWCFLICR